MHSVKSPYQYLLLRAAVFLALAMGLLAAYYRREPLHGALLASVAVCVSVAAVGAYLSQHKLTPVSLTYVVGIVAAVGLAVAASAFFQNAGIVLAGLLLLLALLLTRRNR